MKGVKRKSGGRRPKIRAHSNPLDHDSKLLLNTPSKPSEIDWEEYFPKFFQKHNSDEVKTVEIADVGCGFGGLLELLSPIFPDKLILGLEIRDLVVEKVQERIQRLIKNNNNINSKKQCLDEGKEKWYPCPYSNISVIKTNFMKFCVNYFDKEQLSKMFFCFADPHFKKSNHRRRIISPPLLDVYAYVLKKGGILYTITDVKDLYDWNVKHLNQHPLFERLDEEELKDDPCISAMENTDEGKKVTRNGGEKYLAVYKRI